MPYTTKDNEMNQSPDRKQKKNINTNKKGPKAKGKSEKSVTSSKVEARTRHADERLMIYQTFPRVMTNTCENPRPWGKLEENGSGKLNDIDATLLGSLSDMGVNCIWLTGIIEHATKTDFTPYGIESDNPNVVKGEAGSPYAIRDYYDVDPALAVDVPSRMKEFTDCVERIHASGMKVLIDFVPNHTARVYKSDAAPAGVKDFGADDNDLFGFLPSNNYYYITHQQFAPNFNIAAEGKAPYIEFPAKATGNDCFNAFCDRNDWYETVKLNYGHDYQSGRDHFEPVPDTWIKMLSILRFWASKGVDGFRCDMVFMVPLAFWHWVIPQVKKDWPEVIFIGEIYDIASYRPFLDYGCFDYLYDKVNLYDTLVGIERMHYSAARLTGCWQAVDGIGHRMLNFLENHDEVRYASREYADDPSRVIPSLAVSLLISSGPYMIYYGQELGEPAHDNEGFAGDNNRTTIFDYWSLDTMRRWYNKGLCDGAGLTAHERWLRGFYSRMLHMSNEIGAFRSGQLFDLMYANLKNPDFNPHTLFAFVRYDDDAAYLVLANFGAERTKAGINIPDAAFDAIGLEEAYVDTTGLLWGAHHSFECVRGAKMWIEVGPVDAVIIPLPKKSR